MMAHGADDSGFDQPGLAEPISLREAVELSLQTGCPQVIFAFWSAGGETWGVKLGRNSEDFV